MTPASTSLLAPLLVACLAPTGQEAPLARDPGASPAAQDESKVQIDPRAERVLWRMGEYLKSATAFEFHAESLVDEAHPSGQWVQLSRSLDVAVHRGRGIRASVVGDRQNREFWCDLETAAMLDPEAGLYALVEVPGELDAALDHMLDEYGVSWPLVDLAYSDPFVVLVEGVQLGAYVGVHRVDGVLCHHLAFRQEAIDWQIWVDAGARPVPRKVAITYRSLEGAPRFTATLKDWNFQPFLPEVVFAFEAPDGAEQIEMESVRER